MMYATHRIKWLIATCGGVGYSPILPGTLGAFWGIAIYVAICVLAAERWQAAWIAVGLLISCGVTLALSNWAEEYFGEEDSGKFVTDEVVGFLAVVLLFRLPSMWLTIAWAFPLVRILDMIKVPPARRLERLPGGWGVLADDLMASLYTVAVLYALRWCVPSWFV